VYKIVAMRRTALALATLAIVIGLAAAGCGGEEEATPTPETVTGTVTTPTATETETETTSTETTTETGTATETETETETGPGPAPQGDPVAGKQVFTGSAGCTNCHTLADAGSTGTVGPNLDDAKPSEALVVDRVTNGSPAGMPPFKGTLTDQQIADVAAYVSQAAGG
jgi:mono/diheme cytochrome c family protein